MQDVLTITKKPISANKYMPSAIASSKYHNYYDYDDYGDCVDDYSSWWKNLANEYYNDNYNDNYAQDTCTEYTDDNTETTRGYLSPDEFGEEAMFKQGLKITPSISYYADPISDDTPTKTFKSLIEFSDFIEEKNIYISYDDANYIFSHQDVHCAIATLNDFNVLVVDASYGGLRYCIAENNDDISRY